VCSKNTGATAPISNESVLWHVLVSQFGDKVWIVDSNDVSNYLVVVFGLDVVMIKQFCACVLREIHEVLNNVQVVLEHIHVGFSVVKKRFDSVKN
jgi:cytochrome b